MLIFSDSAGCCFGQDFAIAFAQQLQRFASFRATDETELNLPLIRIGRFSCRA